MSILSSNKISIRQQSVTINDLNRHGFKPVAYNQSRPWLLGQDWTDGVNTLRIYFKDAEHAEVDDIFMEHLSIPHGFLDLYEGNRLKNLGQLLDLIWASKVMGGSKEREILQNCRIQHLRYSSKDKPDYSTITF